MILVLNPHGSDETISRCKDKSPMEIVLNPHGSDETQKNALVHDEDHKGS